jgi:hypothetical protein
MGHGLEIGTLNIPISILEYNYLNIVYIYKQLYQQIQDLTLLI